MPVKTKTSSSQKKRDLSQSVMKQIKSQKIIMQPKAYFVAGSVVSGLSLGFVIMAVILVFARAAFRLRIHGPLGYLWFGQPGLRPFMATFPWIWLFLGILGTAIGIRLLTRYDISYKKGLLSIVLTLLIGSLTSACLIDKFGLNDRLSRLKPLQPLYQEHFTNHNWLVGTVSAQEGQKLLLTTPQGQTYSVILTKKTLLPFGQEFDPGDRVRVIGNWVGDTFEAQGIGKGGLHWRLTITPKPGELPDMPMRQFRRSQNFPDR